MLVSVTNDGSVNEGRLLDGRYRLGVVLGTGGVAEVYRARDERLERSVAVKLFRGDVGAELHRHEDEMRTLARLNHPALVTVLDAGTDDLTQQPYLVMELVEGATLADTLRAGPLGLARAGEIGASVADALAYVHGQGLVHRDVKPANVLISTGGRVYLADFGIARLVDSVHLTRVGDVVGTPSYFAPEQVSGEPVGPPADVYALGLVLLECLTGRREYEGTSLEAAMARLNRQPAVPPTLPPAWRDLLVGMTAREPSSRLSAAQVADRARRLDADARAAATAVLGADPATVPFAPPTTVMPQATGAATTAPTHRRSPWLVVAAVALVIIAIAVVAAVVLNNQNNGATRTCSPATPTLPAHLESDMAHLEQLTCK
jgi:eukaryotic-like serine/threonine-protein kinase